MVYTNILEKAAQERTILEAVNTSLELCSGEERLCVRAAKISKLDQNDANTFVNVKGIDFHNGTISVDVCGKLLADAPAHARGSKCN